MIRDALNWLKDNNELYEHIIMNTKNLDSEEPINIDHLDMTDEEFLDATYYEEEDKINETELNASNSSNTGLELY
jgi:hypothetical protein